MALFQTGTGYRDPNKAMTIKALQERQKAAAAASAQASAMPAQIASPWQGAAHLANILGSSVQEGRAASAEADARQQLTQIMAGVDPDKGMTPQQYAEARALDPEMADRQYEAAMAERRSDENRRETQAFTTSEREAGNQFTAGQQEDTQAFTAGQQEDTQAATAQQNDLNRRADLARQKLADANANNRQEDAQAATVELADINAQIADTKANKDAARDVTAIGTESAAKVAEAKRLGLVEGTPEYQKLVFDISPGSKTYINGEQDAFAKESGTEAAKRLGAYIDEGASSKAFISQVRMVADLGKSIGTGKWAQVRNQVGPYLEMMPWFELDKLGESQAYEAITSKMAPAMRPAGSGPTSNYDAQQFLTSLQKISNDPKGNEIIEFTFEALAKNKEDAAEIASKVYSGEPNPDTGEPWKWHEAEAAIRALPNPYDTFKQYMAGTATPPTADGTVPPPADAAGGGAEQSIDDILKGIP